MQFNRSADGSSEKIEAQKQLQNEILSRQQVDQNIHQIIALVFGEENVSKMIESIRPAGQPLVDDWDCLKMLVSFYIIIIFFLINSIIISVGTHIIIFKCGCLYFFNADVRFNSVFALTLLNYTV